MAIEYRSNNKARLTVYIGKDLKGKDIYARKTITYTSKKDAKAQYEEFAHEAKNGQINAGTSIGLIDLCNKMLAKQKRAGRKATTIKGYEAVIKRVEKMLGNPQAKKITPLIVDSFIDELAAKYSPKTIRNTIFYLNEVYKQGIKWKVVTSNPFESAELPPMDTKEKKVLNADEIGPFYEALQACRDRDLAVATELALFCGLRRSEIMGLKIEHIDFVNGTVSIESTRHSVNHEAVIQTTKTKQSTRVLALPGFLVDDINALIREHKEKGLAIREYQRSDYLILDGLGVPIEPNTLGARLRKFEEVNSLPNVSLHGLRHTHASLAHYLGHSMAEISRQLGHSQLSTTMNIYTHLVQGATAASKALAGDMDRMISWEDSREVLGRK